MRKSRRDSYHQAYNAQAAVDADGGYVNRDSIQALEANGVEVYAAISREDHNYRRYDFRPEKEPGKGKKVSEPLLIAMQEKLKTPEARKIYARRCATMEPVFGNIKEPMKFRQFLLRRIGNVKTEWNLVCLSCNMKRMRSLAGA